MCWIAGFVNYNKVTDRETLIKITIVWFNVVLMVKVHSVFKTFDSGTGFELRDLVL